MDATASRDILFSVRPKYASKIIEGTKTVEAAVVATRFGLPTEGARLQAARPPNAHSQYGTDSAVRVTPIEL